MSATDRVRNAEELSRRVRSVVEESRDFILDALAPVPSPNGRTDTRRQVLEAATGLFGRNGFEACTMRDLASAASVKPPALYNHFGSKEQILAEVMRDALGRFFRTVLEPLADEPSTSWLAGIVQRHTRFQIDELELALAHDMLRSSEHRQSHLPEADADTIRQVESAYYNIVRELLRARTGWRSHKRLTVTTFAILAICDRTNAWYRPGGSLRSEQVAALNWELVEQMTAAE
jgi:AcrR family transcriptional regulator